MQGRALGRFFARRLIGMLLTLLVTSFLVFGSLYLAPGSPIAFLIGHHQASAREIAQVRAQYHLNESFFSRYWDWLTAILHGHFGNSIVYGQSVGSLLGPRVLTTVLLVAYASVLALGLGIALGIAGALGGRIVDRAVLITTSVGVAIPSFVAAIVLLYVFAVQLDWFPSFGAGSGLPDRLWHLTLPAISLALGSVALLTRFTRAAVREELRSEHVETAVTRGLPRGTVFRRHVLRNSLIPITASGGIVIATMIVAVAVVEKAFALDGLGAYLIDAVDANDFPVVQAIALLFATAYVVLNTVIDLIYAAVDPRVAAATAR
ncbi:MAG: ABC transporter permease [Solirubrobacteraceae bacterium]